MDKRSPLDRAFDKLLANASPRSEAESLDDEERDMLRVAQLLHGASRETPRAGFADHLRARLFGRRGISRRDAVVTGLGALAAGILAGVGLDRASQNASPAARFALVGRKGRWFQVATVADVPEGSVQSFSAGALEGFLIHRRGTLRAVSRICTHMGCALNFSPDERAFVCPCHGAEFNLLGHVRYGPHGYGTALPPLPEIRVRRNGEAIEVWSI